MAEDIPKTIGRYEIQKELGRGMMGVVYEAVDPTLGRTIALKTVELSFAVSPAEIESFEKRFFAEARIGARLSHPGVVIIHDVGRDPRTGTLYIAMERLQGRTLAATIKEGASFGWRPSLSILRSLADALQHAHSQGVVHRDMKPANIMILPSGEPKIMDFGIAKIATSRIKITFAGQFLGTPLYMSPEQALGRDVDARSDLFSLGAIAYSLITGRNAFAAESIPKIVNRVIREDPAPPSHLVRDLPPEVDYLVRRSLAKDPVDRYPDARAMVEDIDDILSGQSPRHRAGWTAPSLAEGTLVGPIPTLEAFESGVADEAGAAHDVGATIATFRPPPPPITAPPAPKVSPRNGVAPILAGVVALAGVIALAVLPAALMGPGVEPRRALPTSAPSLEPPPGTTPSPVARPVDAASPPAMEPGPVVPSLSPSRPQVARAQIAFDLEHPLKGGTLRVWVDQKLVVDQALEGRLTREVVGIRIHKGRFEDVVDVSPGKHVVRVQVAWEDNRKEESVSGTFKAGATHHLEIRLGRIRKNLSLEWK